MTFRRQLPSLLLSLSCLSTVMLAGCMTESESLEENPELSELVDLLETPIDLTVEPTGQSCETYGAAAACLDDQSAAFCAFQGGDVFEFGECVPELEFECVFGDSEMVMLDACGEVQVTCRIDNEGTPMWSLAECPQDNGEEGTPLVLRFDNAPIQMIDFEATPAATFDISMASDASSCISTDWPTADTPWLAIDLDHSGTIDGGHELFGSGTDLASGGKAEHGFLALAVYDDNRDGKVDAHDSHYADLLLWRDFDADRHSTPDELEPLSESGVDSLSVDYIIDRQCDARGNCGVQRAAFEHAGGQGEIVDIYLTCQ